jgi:hypothetical protein
MAEAPAQAAKLRLADLIVDRDLTDDEVEQIRRKIDSLTVRARPTQAAHHHDVTPLQ